MDKAKAKLRETKLKPIIPKTKSAIINGSVIYEIKLSFYAERIICSNADITNSRLRNKINQSWAEWAGSLSKVGAEPRCIEFCYNLFMLNILSVWRSTIFTYS